MKSCKYYSDLMKAQLEFIKIHLPEHMYFNHIENENNAMIDFINKFAWGFRDGFCLACENLKLGKKCNIYRNIKE